jgi:hypothetical protein
VNGFHDIAALVVEQASNCGDRLGDAVFGDRRVGPDRRQELLLRNDAPAIANEIGQDIEYLGRYLDDPAPLAKFENRNVQ